MLDALSGHELIMHGADYDLRLLSKHHEFVPQRDFRHDAGGAVDGLQCNLD